ncbi:transcriptional adapter 2B [Onthophagus taurus]|uniref:transcriptional adapter 2B n=1 Tax=Onthophagus taurus TaxID=166361 RepID=UPI000C1FFA57|nr:transcriptional adapter 2B isoform X1 [Onthophagus taurus]XP_022913845.1 transcriptional adapter 2B isoform X2 [Onthophagus taurus]
MADLFSKVNCTYCQEEINGVRVQCCDCVDFDICLQCFSSGAEIGSHKNDHSYRFMDHCAVSVFGGRGNWTGREQLLLLDAVESYGFGNWELISKHVKTRTADEVKEEYIQRYLEGNIGKATLIDIGNSRPILQEHIGEDKGPLSPDVTSRLPPLDVTPEEARQLGYMSHRDDYEREYDMAAEQLVSSLHLNSAEEGGMETALKLAQVGMYIRRLRERYRRKRVVRDYQLVAKFFANQRKDINKKPLTKEQKDLRDNMRVFSQFLTSGEHDRLIASVERERELRHRLSELMRYRSVGLTTQDEIIHYEQHAEYQRQQKLRQKAGGSGLVTSIPEQLKNGKDPSQSLIDEKWLQNVESDNSTFCPINNSDSVVPPPPSTLPHGSLLSQHEAELCSSLNIQPVQYITMKSLIIQDNLTTGKTKIPDDLNTTEEAEIRDVVTQYLNISGWLSVV